MTMKVKICGITRLEDAITAITLGADMLGFNFYERSKRYITPAVGAAIIQGMQKAGVTAVNVGIFVNAPLHDMVHIMAQCNLDFAQLCGDEPVETLLALKGKAFKAIRPASLPEAKTLMHSYSLFPHEPAILIDAYHPGEYGGSGQTGDWAIAAQFAPQYALMLAGGLTPDNVKTAVQQVQPWGVDVASGVESAPGVKDAEKVRQFIENAKSANREP